MSLTILTDDNVKDVLGSLTIDDLKIFQESLREALHKYSTGTQDEGACAMHQPERTVLVSPGGVTSLFMPSISSSGLGIKVVSLSTSQDNTRPHGALTIMTSTGLPYAYLNATTLTAFRTALSSSLLISRRTKPKTLVVFGSGAQAYWHLRLSLLIHGSSVKNIHIITRSLTPKSASLMKTLHSMPFETKEREGWTNVKIGTLSEAYGEYERLIKEYIRAADMIFCTTPSTTPLFDHSYLTSNEGRKKGRLIVAIGSYKPDMIEIPVEVVRQAVKERHKHHHHRHAQEGGVVVVDTLSGCVKEAGEIIQSGIGPYQLVEIGELVMLESQLPPEEHQVVDRLADLDIELPLDSLNDSRKASPRPSISTQASSISTASSSFTISTKSTTPSSNTESSSNSKSLSKETKSKKKGGNTTCTNDDALCRWLRDGNVVYKSVGMGLMDLVVGKDVVGLAGKRGIGVGVEGF